MDKQQAKGWASLAGNKGNAANDAIMSGLAADDPAVIKYYAENAISHFEAAITYLKVALEKIKQ